MTVTSDLVEAYLKCPTKCFLLSREEVGTENAYAEWTRTKSASFRSEGIQRLVTRLAPEKCATSMPGIERLRATHWQLATDFKACSNNLQVSCHAVERIPPSGRGGAEQFAPIRFVFRNKLTRDDKLVIAFDGLVLSEMLRLKVEIGKICTNQPILCQTRGLRRGAESFAVKQKHKQQPAHMARFPSLRP